MGQTQSADEDDLSTKHWYLLSNNAPLQGVNAAQKQIHPVDMTTKTEEIQWLQESGHMEYRIKAPKGGWSIVALNGEPAKVQLVYFLGDEPINTESCFSSLTDKVFVYCVTQGADGTKLERCAEYDPKEDGRKQVTTEHVGTTLNKQSQTYQNAVIYIQSVFSSTPGMKILTSNTTLLSWCHVGTTLSMMLVNETHTAENDPEAKTRGYIVCKEAELEFFDVDYLVDA